jgi:hypothetical protein
MIVIRVELHSARDGSIVEIARAIIANKGNGTPQRGDYDVATFRGRGREQLNRLQIQRRGKVDDHPRLSLHVWHLVAKALAAMGYGQQG